MKLNVNFEIFDLDGNSFKDKANRYIASILMDGKGDSLKLFELGMSINKNDSIELDTADLKLIEDTVKANAGYSNIIKGAILKEIENQKVLSKKKD